jgi:NAD(P)-dependent dehydrogenase (short-subunit alcohol dehydrogenase family)
VLNDRIAIITSAGSGIGRAAADVFYVTGQIICVDGGQMACL